jgi:hypothetical protein
LVYDWDGGKDECKGMYRVSSRTRRFTGCINS